MASRRDAREIAMQILYTIDNCDFSKEDAWESFLLQNDTRDISSIQDFLYDLVNGTCGNLEIIDEAIKNALDNWDFERIAYVDKAILRIAAYELFFVNTVPIKVVIDEAVELAKDFSTPDSGKFVNGVLDRLKEKRGAYEKR